MKGQSFETPFLEGTLVHVIDWRHETAVLNFLCGPMVTRHTHVAQLHKFTKHTHTHTVEINESSVAFQLPGQTHCHRQRTLKGLLISDKHDSVEIVRYIVLAYLIIRS